MFVFGAAWVATERARWIRDLIEATRKRMGVERKAFCAQAGLTEQQYSDQIALRAPMNVFRLADVEDFWRTFLDVLAEHEDCLVVDKRYVSLIVKVQESPRPMLRADVPQFREDRKRA